MTNRLRAVLVLTALVYTAWITFTFIVGSAVSAAEIAGNVFMGLVFGVMSTFLADHDAKPLFLRDLLVHMLFFAALSFMFAAFTLRGNFTFGYIDFFGDVVLDRAGLVGYLWHFLWRGALLGVFLWLLTLIAVGANLSDTRGWVLSAGAAMVGLFAAPLATTALFNGAIFLITAVGVRVMLALLVERMPVWWRSFVFGAAAGTMMVFLPFLGYFGYGVV